MVQMDKKLLRYLRKNFLWEVPGRFQAMQYFRASEYPVDSRWPDSEEIQALKDNFSEDELRAKCRKWDEDFERNVLLEMEKYPEKFPITRCPECGEVAFTPKSERCGECGHTWYGKNPLRKAP